MRLFRWFRRSSRPSLGECFACGAELGNCPRCSGNYLQSGCAQCTLGLVCPSAHQKFWF